MDSNDLLAGRWSRVHLSFSCAHSEIKSVMVPSCVTTRCYSTAHTSDSVMAKGNFATGDEGNDANISSNKEDVVAVKK